MLVVFRKSDLRLQQASSNKYIQRLIMLEMLTALTTSVGCENVVFFKTIMASCFTAELRDTTALSVSLTHRPDAMLVWFQQNCVMIDFLRVLYRVTVNV